MDLVELIITNVNMFQIFVGVIAAFLSGAFLLDRSLIPSTIPNRPEIVKRAIERDESLYYFGIGSNMSRKKLEGRTSSKINILTMEPATVPGFRLAFDLPGFLPLEPSMGSLEPLKGIDESVKGTTASCSTPIDAYEGGECHGALVCLSAKDYEKVYRSEGGGRGRQQQYEEIIIEAIPYDKKHPPVKAVAFRSRDHARLKIDACPSLRYMSILRKGAEELHLKPEYQDWLSNHPVQKSPRFLNKIAAYNLVFTVIVSFRLKLRAVSTIQNKLLWIVHLPHNEMSIIKQFISQVATGLILLPGSLMGLFILPVLRMTGNEPPMLKLILKSHIEDDPAV